MASLSDVQIGSIVSGMLTNIPVGISGILTTIVDQQIYYAEQVTGDDIDTSAVAEKYQPAIIDLAIANVMGLMESQGMGTKSVSIGELSITKGMNESTSSSLLQNGLNKLRALGEKINYYQAWS